jgi:hypothetical protein
MGDLGLQDASWSFLSSWDEFSLVSGFFSIPSKRIWEDRGLDAKTGESVTILFDEVIGTSDACEEPKVSEAQLFTNTQAGEKCNVVHGIQLYNHISEYCPAITRPLLIPICIRLDPTARVGVDMHPPPSKLPQRKVETKSSGITPLNGRDFLAVLQLSRDVGVDYGTIGRKERERRS